MPLITTLLVEDNEAMRQAVSEYLRDKGFQVLAHASAESALHDERLFQAEVALVDISLPDRSGYELTMELKANGFEGPVIALTARDSIEDKLTGFASGMHDYVVKPFDLRELEARIATQLHIHGKMTLAPITTKRFHIEPRKHRFMMDGKPVKLTLLEFKLMHRLMQSNHVTVPTSELISFVWGDDALLEQPPIRIHISNLRSKIHDTNLEMIKTVSGVGYMLNDPPLGAAKWNVH